MLKCHRHSVLELSLQKSGQLKQINQNDSFQPSCLTFRLMACHQLHCQPHFTIHSSKQYHYFLKNKFIYLFLAALCLLCRARAFSSCSDRGYSLLQCVDFSLRWLLLLWSTGSRRTGSVVVACGLQSAGSVVVVHGLSCSTARGIFPDWGPNSCPLHWQADS